MLKIYKKIYFPYILLFILMLLFHILSVRYYGDDFAFKEILNEEALIPWVQSRYFEWTSRIVIEPIMVIILQLPLFIFYIINSFLFVQVSIVIGYFFNKNNSNIYNHYLICLLCLLYPFNDMSTAGWVATSMNYLWPLSFGLVALIPIKKSFENKSMTSFEKIYCTFSLIYAINQEQMCLLIIGFYFTFIIYYKYNKININKIIYIYFITSVIGMVFILMCPGNSNRAILETQAWYPEYGGFNLFQKVILGINSTFAINIFNNNILILLLLFMFAYLGIKYYSKNILKLILSLYPIIIMSVLYMFKDYFLKIFPSISKLVEKLGVFTNNVSSNLITDKKALLILVMCIVFIVCICVCIIINIKKHYNYLIAIIFLAGFASRVVIGFSPTIYASSNRTFIFLNYSLIIVIYAIIQNLNIKSQKNVFISIISILSSLQYLDLILEYR